MSFFTVDNLGVRFGGVVAVDGVSFEVRPGEVYTIIGPNGAGKTTIFNLIGLIYAPTSGRILFEGREVTGSPHDVAARGIARTFQNIELFEHATVLQNLLIGRHRHRVTNLFEELVFLPRVRRAEIAQREAVEKVIDLLDLAHYRDSLVAGLPYGVRKVIELGRAGTTLAKLTTVFRTGEIQILPQNFEQCLVRCEGDLGRFAVECETNMFLTVALHRLFSSLYSKSYYRSDAFCRRTPQGRRGLGGRRVSRFSPTSLRPR